MLRRSSKRLNRTTRKIAALIVELDQAGPCTVGAALTLRLTSALGSSQPRMYVSDTGKSRRFWLDGVFAEHSVAVAGGRYYYRDATLAHSAPGSVTVILRNVEDLKNGVPPLRR